MENELPPREQETHGGGVVKVKERQVEAKWCPCLHAGDLREPIEALEFVINDLNLVIKTTLFMTFHTLCFAYLKTLMVKSVS
jgi:hypothetical protein